MRAAGSWSLGAYVHVPFCASRCDYCAFATWVDRDHLMERYVTACVAEAQRAWESEKLPPATSVFVGGGTPSRLAIGGIERILAVIPREPCAEVTVECNPEDASTERFASWRDAGVNRVSFGAQSMIPTVLAGLGRHHDVASTLSAVTLAAEAGFTRVSLDLIFGGPGETDAAFEATLDAVLGLQPPPGHVSCYALTVEPGTPLAADAARHPDDDVQARRYEIADAVLEAAGYRWYEVSNWAIPGQECKHNRLYWSQGDYRGIGCAAHSHSSGQRWWNVRTPERYISAVEQLRSPEAAREVLDPSERAFEELLLAVRTADGVPWAALGGDRALEELFDRRGDRAVLNLRGRLLANEVAARLVVPPSLANAGGEGRLLRNGILPQ